MRIGTNLLLTTIVLIALATTSTALTLDATTEVIVNTMVGAGATLPPGVSQFNASIHYYPRHGPSQNVTDHRVTSIPTARQSGEEGTILLSWNRPGPAIEFTTSDRIISTPTWIPFTALDTVSPLTQSLPADIAPYTFSTPFIDSDHPTIRDSAREITADSRSHQESAWRIAQWVRSSIAYNISTLTRDVSQKASWTLENKQGVCDELSVLFIALLRASGIPARFVNGMVYSDSGAYETDWGSHAWAEVWFPSTGWVPFDITFGQFGWLDASHIRVADHIDIDESSVEYRWKGPDGVQFSPITISGAIRFTNTIQRSKVNLKLIPPEQSIGPGSTIAITARLTNTHNQWIPLTISLLKAPGFLGSNLKPVLLPPQGTLSVPILITIPEVPDASPYTSTIEASLSTGERATTTVSFSSDSPIISAQDTLDDIRARDLEEQLDGIPELETRCTSDQVRYDLLETFIITCAHRNTAGEIIEGATCFEGACQRFVAKPGESDTITFNSIATATYDARPITQITDETGINRRKTSITPIRVSFTPVFTVTSVTCPPTIGYDQDLTISTNLNSTKTMSSTLIRVEGQPSMPIGTFIGEKTITTTVRGSSLIGRPTEDLIVYSTGYLPDGRRVEDFERCLIEVTGAPWWAQAMAWIANLL